MKQRAVNIILLYLSIGLCGVILLYLLQNRVITFRCIFRDMTGLRCPGCGNTAAMLSVFRGRLAEACSYNLLFYPEMCLILYVLTYTAYVYIRDIPFSKTAKTIIIFAAAITLIWGIIRNIT